MIRNFIFLVLMSVISLSSFSQIQVVTETPQGISSRLQHEIDITKDPKLGYVPKWKLVDAYKNKKEKIKNNPNANSSNTQLATTGTVSTSLIGTGGSVSFTWTERGPYKDAVGPSNGNTRANSGITAGRVRAIWEDLDGSTIWVGGMDGGLWKTSSIASRPAGWVPINDFFANMAIASITQDPTDPNIMYFGTGEKAANADAVRGAGIWMSSDHGATWNIMTGTSNFWNVSKVVCDAAGNLYVGCSYGSNAGLQRFTKSSGTWDNITPNGLDSRIADIELSSSGRLHVSCGYLSSGTTGYRFTDIPSTVSSTTWTSPTTSFTPTNVNVDLASNGNTLIALPSDASYYVSKMYKSTDGGLNWIAITTPGFQKGQAWYNLAAAIDPNNANNMMVGGLDCYKSTNGGSSWTQVSTWVGTTGQYVHADQHIILWNKNNRLLVGCDGGVHYSADGGTTFSDRNEGLRIKQFYSVAVHPTSGSNYFLAGAQDNGVHQLNSAGLAASVEVTGGDGAFVHIDQDQPAYQWGSYVYSNYRRSIDGGASWSSVTSNNTGRFINPTEYDDVNNIMYCSYSAGTFARWDNAQTGGTLTSISMSGIGTGTVSAIKASPFNKNTVYFGGGGSSVAPSLIRAANANTSAPTYTNIISSSMSSMKGANISSIDFGTNDNNIIVSFSNYGVDNVWITNDGGTTWNNIDGALPDMPVRWAMFYPGDNTKAIIGTETGVWQTALINGSSTIWDPEPAFPNVRVDMLQYRPSDGTLVASTHGRGLFSTTLTAATTCKNITQLSFSNITTSGATLSWTAVSGATNYKVDYKLSSSSTWITGSTTSTSFTLTGLLGSGLYDVRVGTDCSSSNKDYVFSQFKTSTVTACGTVTGLSSSLITKNSATLKWTALSGAASYDVDYQIYGSATWTNTVSATTSLSVNLTSLNSSTRYNFRVRANCTGNATPGAYAQAEFSTLSDCPSLYDNSVSNDTYTTASGNIPLNTNIGGLISSSTDVDFYKFNITKTGSITITLTGLPANYDVSLLSSTGGVLKTSAATGTTNETISQTLTATGTYYVKVYGVSGANNASSCYTLKVALGTAQGTGAQMGDIPLASPSLFTQNVTETKAYFSAKIYPNPTESKVTIYMIGDNTKKQLSVYDATGKSVYSMKLNEMYTTLNLQKLKGGAYFVQIRNESGQLLYSERIIKN